ncbi:MAG: Trk system potassium transporter TrkA [Gammaproteobacteria bacterium]|nr:Trk system potassium transporter TrkA [Gammaproteobacteria bacterium]
MKIIILGAGQVGSSMAEILADEANDITLVDINTALLQSLQDRFDIRAVAGCASYPDVLAQAGGEDADIVLAVTNRDEVNMIACQIAHSLFQTPTKIARIRAAEYLSHPEIFSKESIPIDVIISPEQIVTQHILRLIEYPGALQVIDFADGKIQLVAIKAFYGGPLVGHELRELRDHMPNIDTRVAAIYRKDRPITPNGDTVIEPDDEVFLIAAGQHIREVMSELRHIDKPGRRIMLVGAGNIGYRLAAMLEQQDFHVRLIENNLDRARQVSELLNGTVVLQGDAADEELMLQENIENTDVFCALTNDDETNILSAMLAKRLGAKNVMAIINRSAYVDLIESSVLDIAISPRMATVGTLLTLIRRGDVVAAHSLRRGAAEAIEAVAHGDESSSKVVGRAISEIKLPPGTTLGAILRGNDVLIAHDTTVIQSEDHVILFVVDKRHIPELERLFQVGVTFI